MIWRGMSQWYTDIKSPEAIFILKGDLTFLNITRLEFAQAEEYITTWTLTKVLIHWKFTLVEQNIKDYFQVYF